MKVQLKHIWKIFGANPAYVLNNLNTADTRADILSETGHVVAVRDVSLEIGEGEIFVVMGLSGSGKSTLIRCLSRLIEPTAGQVIINEQDVTQMNTQSLRDLRRHTVSMVFQRFGLFPHRRVIDNVGYGLEIQGVKANRRQQVAQTILEVVGLDGWENHYPHELSGGMQQRVGLARALAVNPEILLCDEPFSALDPLIRRDMQDELLHLQKTFQKTILFITHDFMEAIKLGDRIAIMKDGEIVQIGTPQQIVANPVDDYVRDFTQDVPRAKVLTAAEVMQPTDPTTTNLIIDDPVPHSTSLEKLIPLVLDLNDNRLAVADDDGQLIGTLERNSVLLALAEG